MSQSSKPLAPLNCLAVLGGVGGLNCATVMTMPFMGGLLPCPWKFACIIAASVYDRPARGGCWVGLPGRPGLVPLMAGFVGGEAEERGRGAF